MPLHGDDALPGASVWQRRYLRLAVGDDADGVLVSALHLRLGSRSEGGAAGGRERGAAIDAQTRRPVRRLGIRRDRRGSAQTKPQRAAERVKTVNSEQWSVASGQGAGISMPPAIGVCCVQGCGGAATEDSEVGIFCMRCWDEITALRAMAAAERAKHEARELRRLCRREERRLARESTVKQFRRVGRFVGKWLWVPELVFVGGVLLYLGAVYGYALLDWLGW